MSDPAKENADDSSVYESSEDDSSAEQTESSPPEILHKHEVQMQRLAKKRRLFVIQKITRRVKVLKNKKGNDQQLSKNARKCERLVQKIPALKAINLEKLISEMISEKFTKPTETESVMNWFKSELLEDKFSFMSYANEIRGLPPIHPKRTKQSAPVKKSSKTAPDKGDLFVSSLSSYQEETDDVLKDILKEKRNRPGQRARQKKWEEMYGQDAKHLKSTKFSKNGPRDKTQLKGKGDEREKRKKGEQREKRKKSELPPQQIIKKLKVETKEAEKKEHPSWVAKKLQASLSNKIDVFAGVKTTFSDDDD